MRIFLTVMMALFLLGCSAKIAPGKVYETTTKATPEMSREPKAPQVSKTEHKVVKEVLKPEVVEDQNLTEEVIEEETPKPRFQRSELISSHPYKVTMKTKKFAFSDTGFMNVYDNLLNLQVFSMGKIVLDLTVKLNDDEICVGSLCNTKHGFNQTFLSGQYPDTLVENILQSKPILGGKNLRKMTKGFIQKIITREYAIKYKIWPGNVYFKDAKNNIIIKLRKLPK
jgi:hypothetical protein